MNISKFVSEISKLSPSSTFLTLKGYRSESGELADYSIVFNMSYENALLRSIATLNKVVTTNELEAQAKKECLESFMTSLDKLQTTPIEEIDDAYRRFTDSDGKYIKGVKLHEESDTLHLYGLVVHKKVIMPGIFKKVNHKPLTVEKNKLRNLCQVSRFRQFKITTEQVESICVQGLKLLPPDATVE